ncbi:MAG TPA: class I lanthipeptide [Thermoanaerobaculia bacterium]|nr:class I lanthipeptide [Thermoanaerobaculia bacterium]
MKKINRKLTLNRETLRLLTANEIAPVVGGVTGPDSHCTTRLDCPTGRTECRAC